MGSAAAQSDTEKLSPRQKLKIQFQCQNNYAASKWHEGNSSVSKRSMRTAKVLKFNLWQEKHKWEGVEFHVISIESQDLNSNPINTILAELLQIVFVSNKNTLLQKIKGILNQNIVTPRALFSCRHNATVRANIALVQ